MINWIKIGKELNPHLLPEKILCYNSSNNIAFSALPENLYFHKCIQDWVYHNCNEECDVYQIVNYWAEYNEPGNDLC